MAAATPGTAERPDASETPDASPFAVRGVIEGYYGRPWTHEQRLRLIDFVGGRGMNTFVYTPKDDPLVRREWRTAYDGDALAHLRELLDRCRANGMGLTYCASPGLDIRHSDEADLTALVAKLQSVAALGVDSFGLLLDDIPRVLHHAEDRAAFSDLATAQVHVIDRVFRALGPTVTLTVCPTIYRGTGTEPYLAQLGGALDPRVGLYWTGRSICSETLDLADAATFARTTNRLPTYWDNYPVNDVAMGYELHIGPYQGRDPHLSRASVGIVANGMELFESSLIPFATIADYLRAPESYDPETSWQQAIRDVVGDADADAFGLFADNVRSSCLTESDAPIVSQALESFHFRHDRGDGVAASAELGALADRLLEAAAHLLRGPVVNRALIDEVRPWLVAFELGAQALRAIADLAACGTLVTDGPAVLRPFQIGLRRLRVRVFGDALEMTLSDLTGMMFRPGEVPEFEGGGS
ncbi:MAG: protein O-GlcNAcase [Chloroflexi bacterium]|nr:protein O-GlcNAcase [Chloroflexota bacterium]